MGRGVTHDVSGMLTPATPMTPRRHRAISELLDERTRRPVCLVIGAAGCGKSTAVAGWAAGTRTAWIRHVGPDQPAGMVRALQAAVAPHAGLPVGSDAGALQAWLATNLRDDLTLVIDNVQDLRPGRAAARFVGDLCEHAPPRLRIVLVSRTEPPFSLARLRRKGGVAEICAPELALDLADVDWVLRRRIEQVPPELSLHVWERTSGWPAAVAAAADALQRADPDHHVAAVDDLVRPGTPLHAFVDGEVVGVEEPSTQNFLRHLAVFGEVTEEREHRHDATERAALLSDLTRRGLVVRHADRDGTRWTLMRPLRDFYGSDALLTPVERRTLHLAAAQDCLTAEATGEALQHLVAAGDHLRSVAVLTDTPEVAAAGVAVRRLDVPAEARSSGELEPRVAWRLMRGAIMGGELDDVRSVFERTRFGPCPSDAGPSDAGPSEAAAPDAATPDSAQVLALAAITCRLRGDVDGLRELSARAAAAARRCGSTWASASAQTALALLAGVEADRRTLAVHCAGAMESAADAGDLVLAAAIWVTQAAHLVELGMPQQAVGDARIAIRIGVRCNNPFITAHALTTRGRANLRLGALDEAAADLETAVEMFQRIGSRFLAWPLCGLGELHTIRGRLARARGAFEEALALAEPCHDVLGMSVALSGLARVRVADDPDGARALAERAVALQDGLRAAPAMLTRGWVALIAGDARAAADDAAAAAAAARRRRDDPGLAEAIMLAALAGRAKSGELLDADAGLLGEAIDIWREAGCAVDAALATVVADRMGTASPADVEAALQTLRDHGIDIDVLRAAGPMAAVLRPAEPPLTIRTLGSFQVLRDGAHVPGAGWRSRKARDLLKVLVSKRRPVPREQLIELLWPGSDPAKSANRMSVLLSGVRDMLGPDRGDDGPLTTDGNTVGLDRRHVVVDVDRFLATSADALTAFRAGDHGATALLIAAEAMHAGGYLEDDPYQDWAQPLAEEVRAAHIAVLRALAAALRTDDLDGMVRYTLRLLEHDGYDEPAHVDLVSALLDAGRLGEARRRYQLYTKVMKEIGVDPRPMPEMDRLRRRLRGA